MRLLGFLGLLWLLCFPVFCSAAAVLVALRLPSAESNAVVLERGLWAIESLSNRNAANQAQLGKLGACKGKWWAWLGSARLGWVGLGWAGLGWAKLV